MLNFGMYSSITSLHGSFGVSMSKCTPSVCFLHGIEEIEEREIFSFFLPRGIKDGSAVF